MDTHRVLTHFRNSVSALPWQPGKWLVDFSEFGASTILWTYCGDRINRALAKMFTLPNQKEHAGFDLARFIEKLKNYTAEEMIALAKNEVRVVWFSKFGPCLPEDVALKAIIERTMDFAG